MRRALLIVGVLALLAPSALEAATTSRLTGEVVDGDGTPLPGVSVQLWSEVLIGGRQTAISDGAGRVAFNLLPPGPYSLRAELAGFVPVDLQARVALDTETQVRFVMVAQDFGGEIEVTAVAPLVDTAQVGLVSSYDRDYLKNASVGIEGRDWQDTVLQSPGATSIYGVSPRNIMEGKNPNIMGSLQSENTYLIDWLNVTDPLTGTFYAWLNHDAIQEVSEQSVGLDAEYGYALGAVINLVTRSGGNSFHGSLDVRYRDESMNESGEHFDPDENISSLRAITAVLGGPVLRDRLWFFASFGQRLEQETPTDAVVTREMDRRDWLAKLSWQASESTRVIVKLSDYPVDDQNFNAGDEAVEYFSPRRSSSLEGVNWGDVPPSMAPEAYGRLQGANRVAQAELHAVLSDSLLLSVQTGFNRGELDVHGMADDPDLPVYLNADTGVFFNNSPYYYFSERDSDHYRAGLSWFVDEAVGRHELKAGVEHRRLESTTVGTLFEGLWIFPPGGVVFIEEPYDPDTNPDGLPDLDGDGWVDSGLIIFDQASYEPLQTSVRLWGAFLQDTWRPLAGLTVKAGLRYDVAEHSDLNGRQVAELDDWQPRLGVAWDPVGRGEQVLRASWARSMHPASTKMSSWLGEWSFTRYHYEGYERYCGQAPGTFLCDREWLADNIGEEDTTVDEQGNAHYWYLQETVETSPDLETLDTMGLGRLDAPWSETLSVAAESRLWGETSLELAYVKKKTRELIEDTCANNTWVWDESVPEPSLDDPSTWTPGPFCGGGMGTVLANVPQARRDYEAWIARLEGRHRDLHFKLSYTWSRSEGSSHSETWYGYFVNIFDVYPHGFVNMYGFMDDDRRHRVKLSGYALLPWDLSASFAYAWASAPPVDVWADCEDFDAELLADAGYDPDVADYCQWPTDIYLEPRGSRRGRSSSRLDLGIAKAFHFSRLTLELNLAVLNVLNDEQPRQYNEYEDFGVEDDIEIGEVTKWTEPRRYQVGVRIDF